MLTEFKPGGLDKLSKGMSVSRETPRDQAHGKASVRRDQEGVARQVGRDLDPGCLQKEGPSASGSPAAREDED